MSPRAVAARVSAGVLLVLLLRADDPVKLFRRARVLVRSASLELKVRQLNGSAAAFDRNFFVFLESIRERLPTGAPGVAILGPPASNFGLYLATYHLAPVPVAVAPARVPPGWLVSVYGREGPPGWRLIATVPKGALFAPPS